VVAPESPRPALTKPSAFPYLASHSVCLVPNDEHQLVIRASIAGGMCFGYIDRSAAPYAAVDDSHVRITSGNRALVHREVGILLGLEFEGTCICPEIVGIAVGNDSFPGLGTARVFAKTCHPVLCRDEIKRLRRATTLSPASEGCRVR
jgi:hypothetical protein